MPTKVKQKLQIVFETLKDLVVGLVAESARNDA